MAGVNLDRSVVEGPTGFGAGSDESSNVSDGWSSALSTVWDGSGLDEFVLGGSLIAGVIWAKEVHWGGGGWDGPFSEWDWS